MKQIDFTQTGGFPLTQDILAFMQSAYTDALTAMAQCGGNGPFIISGMQAVTSLSLPAIADGWLYYNGEILKFNASPIPMVSTPNITLIKINEADSPLTFYDNSSKNVIKVRSCSLSYGPSATDATQFPYSTLQYYGRESNWTTLNNFTSLSGSITGSISYKKNTLNNLLYLKGDLTAAAPAAFNASPNPFFYAMGILPTGYRPQSMALFAGYTRYHNNLILDDTGTDYIKQINASLDTDGTLSMGWLKAAGAYHILFNTCICLD
jgi:hypothetical protein